MRRVLLLNPPSPPGTTINREGAAGMGNRYADAGAFLYPPQMLATCAAALRWAGSADVALLDATAEGLTSAETLERIAGRSPDILVAQLSWSGWDEDLAFCVALRAALPALPLIVVGTILRRPDYTARAADVCDLVLIGEPERALPAACQQVERGAGPGRVATAAELTPADYDAASYLRDIESLPLPAWDLTPASRYRALTLLSSRGCDARCAYCPYIIGWGPRFRACSPRRTVDELAWLKETFRPARLMFRDPVFAHDRQRVAEICELIVERRLACAWECESRPEHLDADLLRLMRRAGCVIVKVGVESAAPARLVRLGRLPDLAAAPAYLARLREIGAACRRLGAQLHVFLLAGWPDAEPGELEATAQLVRQMAPAHVSVKTVEAYPGTPWATLGMPADPARAEEARRWLAGLAQPAPARRPLWWRALAWLRRRLA